MSETKSYVDHLNRKKLAGQVLDTLLQQTHVKVMSLNGGWGSGKTYFLDFMREYAESKGILFITHNVWENDYLDDPFLSIMAEIESQVTESLKPLTETSPLTWVEKAPYAEYKKPLPTITQHLGLLKEKGMDLLQSTQLNVGIASVNVGEVFKSSPPELKDYQKLKQAKESFKNTLQDLIKAIPQDKNGNKRPLIIAIDEVDRTRPEYAIRTLEVIKHFFDIDGLKFILAVDKKQLQNTVKQMFGQDTETDCYLRKFVDLEWNLPAPSLEMFVKAQLKTKTWDKVFARHKTYVYFDTATALVHSRDSNTVDSWNWEDSLKDSFKERVQKSIVRWLKEDLLNKKQHKSLHQHMSLRDIEKFLSHFKIILQKIPEINCIEVDMLIDLLYIYRKQPNVFENTYAIMKRPFETSLLDNTRQLTSYFNGNENRFITSISKGFIILNHINNSDVHTRYFVRINESPYNESIIGKNDDWHRLIEGLLAATLLDYYEAIQLAGGFNSDD